jgi:sugar phosphate isomerase/epimerase
LLRSHDQELTAIGCLLRHGLDIPENQEQRIDHVKQVMSLSFDLGPRITIVQAGKVRVEEQSPANQLLSEALLTLGQFGDRVGVTLALETGLEAGEVLAQFLARFDTGSLGVNLDPANLLMHDSDPIAGNV